MGWRWPWTPDPRVAALEAQVAALQAALARPVAAVAPSVPEPVADAVVPVAPVAYLPSVVEDAVQAAGMRLTPRHRRGLRQAVVAAKARHPDWSAERLADYALYGERGVLPVMDEDGPIMVGL